MLGTRKLSSDILKGPNFEEDTFTGFYATQEGRRNIPRIISEQNITGIDIHKINSNLTNMKMPNPYTVTKATSNDISRRYINSQQVRNCTNTTAMKQRLKLNGVPSARVGSHHGKHFLRPNLYLTPASRDTKLTFLPSVYDSSTPMKTSPDHNASYGNIGLKETK